MEERPPEHEPDFGLTLKPKPGPCEVMIAVRPEVEKLMEEGRAKGLEGGELVDYVQARNPYNRERRDHVEERTIRRRQGLQEKIDGHGCPYFSVSGDPYLVYFVQERDGYDGPIKIGRVTTTHRLDKTSSHVRQRKSSMQSGNPHQLVILGWSFAIEEKATHALFAHLRIRGEWFRPAAELYTFIDEVCEDG